MAALPRGNLVSNPSSDELQESTSIHVLAFSLHGHLLVVESEGTFDIDTWQNVFDYAKSICCSSSTVARGKGTGKEVDDGTNLEGFLRDTLQKKVALDQRWRESLR